MLGYLIHLVNIRDELIPLILKNGLVGLLTGEAVMQKRLAALALQAVELPEGVEMVMPGDNVQMTVKLICPIAMEEGLRFAIREGGRTVGAGVVAKIIE